MCTTAITMSLHGESNFLWTASVLGSLHNIRKQIIVLLCSVVNHSSRTRNGTGLLTRVTYYLTYNVRSSSFTLWAPYL